MTVAELEQHLQLPVYLDRLKAETGVWNTLQNARKQALKSASGLTVYRRILERSIARLVAERGYDSLAAEAVDAEAYVAWARDLVDALRDVQPSRGLDLYTWTERWFPREYAAYVDAFYAHCATPSPACLARLKTALAALVAIYREPPPIDPATTDQPFR